MAAWSFPFCHFSGNFSQSGKPTGACSEKRGRFIDLGEVEYCFDQKEKSSLIERDILNFLLFVSEHRETVVDCPGSQRERSPYKFPLPTSARIGFCVIWVCDNSSSSTDHFSGQA
jgi:hypothetical protein